MRQQRLQPSFHPESFVTAGTARHGAEISETLQRRLAAAKSRIINGTLISVQCRQPKAPQEGGKS